MKNLKRVLSLALSGIMLVGMMAVGAGAVNAEDFTDADEISHKEAVSIATALKIIDGKEDGSFDPDGYVTRGQMAKMITRAMFGGEDPVLGLPATPTFTDIKGRWDETYIEYCANNSIINGRGDGTFDPEGNVTGTEAAKMLLTALGYKADIYGLVGPDWALTTNSIANQTKVNLYGGLKGLDPSKAFTRDQVAQMVYNTLNANTREMNPTMEITGKGDITYQYTDSGRSLLYDKYGAVRVEGVVTDNEFTDNSDGMKGKTSIAISNADELKEELDLGNTAPTAKKLPVASGKEMFQRAVIVYVKPSNTNKKDLSKGVVISEVIYDTDTNTEITTADNKKLTDWTEDAGLKFEMFGDDGNGNPTTYAKFFVNYDDIAAEHTDTNKANFGYTKTGDGSTNNEPNRRGDELIVIDNDGDGIVNAVLKNTYTFGQVSKVGEKVSVRTNGGGALAPTNEKEANVVAYEDMKVDDYVMSTLVDQTYYITKAEAVEGTLTAYENESKTTAVDETYGNGKTKTLKVDGESYKVCKSTGVYSGTEDLVDIDSIATKDSLTENVTIYLDNFGFAVAGHTEAASSWLFVANAALNDAATGLSSATLSAFVYMEDGTSGSYIVDEYTKAGTTTAVDKFTTATGNTHVEDIMAKPFKYTVKSNGHLVLEGAEEQGTDTQSKQSELTMAGGEKIDYNRDLTKLTLDVDGTPAVKYATMDTVIFFVTVETKGGKQVIKKVQAYNEKEAPSMEITSDSASNVLWTKSSGVFNKGVTYVTTADSARELDALVLMNDTVRSSDWVFLLDYDETVDDGRTYWAYVDGEVTSIQSNDKVVRDVPNAFAYAKDGDKYALEKAPYDLGSHTFVGELTSVDRKSVVVGDAGAEGKLTNSTVIVRVDGKDSELDAGLTKGDIVVMVKDDSDNAEAIFIIAEYDDTKADVAYIDYRVVDKGSKTYDVSVANFASGDMDKLDELAALFVASGKSEVKFLKETKTAPATDKPDPKATEFDNVIGIAEDDYASTAVAATDVWYMAVKAEVEDGSIKTTDGNYVVYTINVKA